MKPLRQIPRAGLSRALATTRAAARAGRSVVAHAVGASADRERALAESLAAELDDMKGLAMKVGQILSSLDAGLPPSLPGALAKLQRGARPLETEVVVAEIEAAFGRPIGELFEAFELEPVASASIGQVHRARFEGRDVAVKVRHPGIRETLEGDLSRLRGIASLASLATAVDGARLVEELKDRLVEECDYRREAAWLAAVEPLLAVEGVGVPSIVPERSNESVLTTLWVDGQDLAALRTADRDRRQAAAFDLARIPWATLFGHGFLHADPHPGNYLFPAAADADRVVVLDWGCVRRVEADELAALRPFLRALLDDDRRAFPDALVAAGIVPDPSRYDFDEGWAMYAWMFAPWRAERFHFTPAWSEEGLRFNRPSNRNNRHQDLPPLWIWLMRTIFGLHAALVRLDADLALRPVLEDALARDTQPIAPIAI